MLFSAAQGLDPELRKNVELICYDTFSPSPVFMDRDGKLVYSNIITHMDRRGREQSHYIDITFGRDNYMNISGIYPFPGGCSAMTFLWFRKNMPEVLENTYAVEHLPTFIHKKLTGEWMVDLVNASMMGMYETTTQGGIMNTTGSSEMVSILTDVPKVSPTYYLRNSALPGLWQIYVTTCGGFGVDWFYDQLCNDMTKDEYYEFEAQAIDEYHPNRCQSIKRQTAPRKPGLVHFFDS